MPTCDLHFSKHGKNAVISNFAGEEASSFLEFAFTFLQTLVSLTAEASFP
jgi:hypothetical protein